MTTTSTVAVKVLLDLALLHFKVEARAKLSAYKLKIDSAITTWLAGGCINKLLEVDKENYITDIQSDRIRTGESTRMNFTRDRTPGQGNSHFSNVLKLGW